MSDKCNCQTPQPTEDKRWCLICACELNSELAAPTGSDADIRKVAIKLYEAGQVAKRKQPRYVWGEYDRGRKWDTLPSESVEVWDAIAAKAYELLSQNNADQRAPK